MRKISVFAAVCMALLLVVSGTISPSLANTRPTTGGPHYFPIRGQDGGAKVVPGAPSVPDFPSQPNLTYRGGPVQTGVHNTYAIYWGAASTFASGYQTFMNNYFINVAAASGSNSNVYSTSAQYYQIVGATRTYITYNEHFAGSYIDTVLPASGCSNTAGGSLGCFTDAQVQAEVTHAQTVNGWPSGLNNQYFVFLGNGYSQCFDAAGTQCFLTVYCAYHSSYVSGGNNVLYASQPYTGHSPFSCSFGDFPNGFADGDVEVSVVSHEGNETQTDPLISANNLAWYDDSYGENGDKCAYNYGLPLGGGSGTHYNQVINGAHYELQQEWSNQSRRCVQRGR